MLWFNFILGLNFLFFFFNLIFINYHTQKEKKINFKPWIKLNHNTYKPPFAITLKEVSSNSVSNLTQNYSFKINDYNK